METKDHHFQKLTLKSDVKLETYQEALDFVFENNDLKNIAITGAYGAGKSSVLESYKRAKQNPKKFLHITLTYFSPDSQNNQQTSQNNSDKGTSENVLEGKILNQLIHQIDASKIPQTNFRVKHKVSKLKTVGVTSFL